MPFAFRLRCKAKNHRSYMVHYSLLSDFPACINILPAHSIDFTILASPGSCTMALSLSSYRARAIECAQSSYITAVIVK